MPLIFPDELGRAVVANQNAPIVIKLITFFGYVGNSDEILTWAGFITDSEGSYPIRVCSTTKEQSRIIVLINRIDPVSTNDRALNWLILLIHSDNIGGDRSPIVGKLDIGHTDHWWRWRGRVGAGNLVKVTSNPKVFLRVSGDSREVEEG